MSIFELQLHPTSLNSSDLLSLATHLLSLLFRVARSGGRCAGEAGGKAGRRAGRREGGKAGRREGGLCPHRSTILRGLGWSRLYRVSSGWGGDESCRGELAAVRLLVCVCVFGEWREVVALRRGGLVRRRVFEDVIGFRFLESARERPMEQLRGRLLRVVNSEKLGSRNRELT